MTEEIIVDNFAGGGGASTGIEMGLGRDVAVAINHDPEAIAMHRINHPNTEHHTESIFDIDPRRVCRGRPVGLSWFSPDCKHFSRAAGKKPRNKNIRGLAWVVVNWANRVQPRTIMLENVEEFQTWGPLNPEGKLTSHRKGWYFDCFVGALRRRGYRVEFESLTACDYGAPTIRKRLFLVARCDGRKVRWPEVSHGVPGRPALRTAAECIDWSIPAPSIFERKKPLADATCRRIAKGIVKYVLEAKQPFIVQTGYGERTGQSPRVPDINSPLGTVVAGGVKHALVMPYLTECANASTERVFSAADPLRTQCAQVKGGHFALVSAFLSRHFGQSIGQSADAPAPTVMANGQGKTQLVAASLCKMRGDNIGDRVDSPLHTVSAGGTHHALVAAFMTKYYGSGDGGQSVRDPFHTVTSRDRFNLVTVQIDGQTYAISDIGLRMLQPHELYAAQGFPRDYIIDRGQFEDGSIRPLTKTAQVRMCGNSVCPPVAAALARANVPELMVNSNEEVAV
jgi:DNA (cytosine-5)-methyltransferase 1